MRVSVGRKHSVYYLAHVQLIFKVTSLRKIYQTEDSKVKAMNQDFILKLLGDFMSNLKSKFPGVIIKQTGCTK